MFCFLNARGYNLLAREDVKLDFKSIHDQVVKSTKRPQKTVFELEKSELPHALTMVLNGMLYVHVVKKPNQEQAFFLVASLECNLAIGKSALNILLHKCTKIAHTIIVLNIISPQAKSLMSVYCASAIKESNKDIYHGELLLKADIITDKLRSKLVSRYQLLNEDEIKELEEKYMKNRLSFPWMLQTEQISLYHGFKKGDVVKIINRDTHYRLVVD